MRDLFFQRGERPGSDYPKRLESLCKIAVRSGEDECATPATGFQPDTHSRRYDGPIGRAPFQAITVRPAGQTLDTTLDGYKQLAEDLGAEVIEVTEAGELSSARIAEIITRVVRERQVTLLVVGRPSGPSGQEQGWLARIAGREPRESVATCLLRMPLTADLYVAMR